MKTILFSVFCLLLSLGLAAQTPAPAADCPAAPLSFLAANVPAAPAADSTAELPFLNPAPAARSCTMIQCRQECPSCPGCFKHCLSTVTCECECICS